jgi:hypothetical protein
VSSASLLTKLVERAVSGKDDESIDTCDRSLSRRVVTIHASSWLPKRARIHPHAVEKIDRPPSREPLRLGGGEEEVGGRVAIDERQLCLDVPQQRCS